MAYHALHDVLTDVFRRVRTMAWSDRYIPASSPSPVLTVAQRGHKLVWREREDSDFTTKIEVSSEV